MLVFGIGFGILAFFIVGSMTTYGVVGGNLQGGVFPGFVAGLWALWPFLHTDRVLRYNFLHPVPRRYNQPLKHVYSKVRQLLSEKTYNFGDKWHVTTSDTIQRRITANLKFMDEESHLEGQSLSNLHVRKERKQRLIELDVQFVEGENDRTTVQLDFVPTVEGAAIGACDSIINGLTIDIDNAIGGGENSGDPTATKLPAPPWWLLGTTALMLMTLWNTINKAVFGP